MPTAPRRPVQEMKPISAQPIAERQQAGGHRQRPRHEHQERGHAERRPEPIEQLVRRSEQAEQQEHDQLREPGRRVLHRHHLVARAHRAVGDDDPGEVNGEVAAAAEQVGQREQCHRAGQCQPRMQARRQHVLVERGDDQAATDVTERQARADRPGQLHREPDHADARVAGRVARQPRGQRHHQEHRHRIVAARFDLQGRTAATLQVQAAGTQQEEHRSRIGRGNDRAEQQRFQQRQVEQFHRRECGQPRRHQHADAGQHHGRHDAAAHMRRARAQATVEQDQRQRQRRRP